MEILGTPHEEFMQKISSESVSSTGSDSLWLAQLLGVCSAWHFVFLQLSSSFSSGFTFVPDLITRFQSN
jgi:hypothetical protein